DAIEGVTVFDCDVLPFEIADLGKPTAERRHEVRRIFRCCDSHEPYDRHCGRLCARRERPGGRAAEQRNEITPFHVWPPLSLDHTLPHESCIVHHSKGSFGSFSTDTPQAASPSTSAAPQ